VADRVRIGIYGTGNIVRRHHLPNLMQIQDAEVVALCDMDEEALYAAATLAPCARTYKDAETMLRQESLDALYSCVPPFARGDVEVAAVQSGMHLFCEKPQALDMGTARRIGDAVRDSGVISTVGFRERYRPIFRRARELLVDKDVVHAEFLSVRPMPPCHGQERNWYDDLDRSGGPALDWGIHAIDYVRFMTGYDVVRVSAYYQHREEYALPVSYAFGMVLSSRATMDMTFVAALADDRMDDMALRRERRRFRIYYVGGYLDLYMYDELAVDGVTVQRFDNSVDPWYEHDRRFVQAIQENDGGLLDNDYRDGLYSLGAVLAGWQSAQRGGEPIDVVALVRD
jgi:predicted dehydrogenase